MGTGIGHYIPLVAYLGFWVMCPVSLAWRPLWGLYFLIPFLPYRSMRKHFLDYPMGAHILLILVLAVIVGALLHGKRLPKSKLYVIWLAIGVYLYFSMWLGAALGGAPAPLWLSEMNFVVWKDYGHSAGIRGDKLSRRRPKGRKDGYPHYCHCHLIHR